jgi:hypothetical protein
MLAEDVKQDVANFVKGCELERAPIAEMSTESNVMPKSKHKIRVAWATGGRCRTIAIFDPEAAA